ncbi:MAG: MMPL family transporter [Gaiellales bacterium]|nr:MMPL family transporter [Gaiellales bacterium]
MNLKKVMGRFSTARIAGWCVRRRWVVIGVWVVLLALAASALTGVGGIFTAEELELTTSSPESVRADALLQAQLSGPEQAAETVIVRSGTLTVDEPAFQEEVNAITTTLLAHPETVASAANYYQAKGAGSAAAEAMVSADRHTTLIPVTLIGSEAEEDQRLEEYLALVAMEKGGDFQVLTIGGGSVGKEFVDTADSDLKQIELFGLPITLFVLVGVFGAVVAAGVSMVLAGVAILVAVGATAVVSHYVDLSFFVVNVVSMLGLAVGIDYSLFITERYREERRSGASKEEAIVTAGGTASRAVLFSGVTVMLALLGLLIVPIAIFHSLAIGALLVVSAAVAAMLTLVPALLSVLGDRIDWPRRRKVTDASRHTEGGVYSGFWGKLTRSVMARPIVSVVVVAVLLLAATVPYFWLQRGPSGADALPEGDVKTAYEVLSKEFSAGLMNPVEVVVNAPRTAEVEKAIAGLQAATITDGSFVPATQVVWSAPGDLAVISIPLSMDPESVEAREAVGRLRADLIPQAFASSGVEVLVTGQTAYDLDSVDVIDDYTPGVFVFVLGLSFVLLLLVFRSIVVPLKAILMNLLSVGASYGILVLVFQVGWGEKLFGLAQTETIEAWVPIFLFCILFGLSMDYHVFLLSRIREHWDETKQNAESVAVGLKKTGRIITGAAVIMVVVFASFAAGKLVMMQQMGFGLAVAVLLDATLVRFVLVPATMALLGNVNWYLPRWLHWLPDLRVEGGGHKAARVPAAVLEKAEDAKE